MITEIVLGFQGTNLSPASVAMTTKHFPGGGPQVEGQDSHFDWGKFAHYPGGMFENHLKQPLPLGLQPSYPVILLPKEKSLRRLVSLSTRQ